MKWVRWSIVSDSVDVNLSKVQEVMEDGDSRHAAGMGSQKAGHNLVTEQQILLKFLS